MARLRFLDATHSETDETYADVAARRMPYPYKRLNEIACTKYGASMTLQVGPFSPLYQREYSAAKVPGQLFREGAIKVTAAFPPQRARVSNS